MAGHPDLKSYLQANRLTPIKHSISGLFSTDHFVKNVTIKTLYITNDDTECNLEIELGVSALIYEATTSGISSTYFFIVKVKGNLKFKFDDIKIIDIHETDESNFIEGSLLNQFLLPDIRTEQLEKIGQEIHQQYFHDCSLKDYYINPVDNTPVIYQFPVEHIIVSCGIPMYFADLPDNCLGRMYFNSVNQPVYHKSPIFDCIINKNIKLQPGTVIINHKHYVIKKDKTLIITICHELIHWYFHQRFFRLLELLGTDADTMSCSIKPIIFDENMTQIQKAHWYAEWQANELAMRLAIPATFINYAMAEAKNVIKTKNDLKCIAVEKSISYIASLYGVSESVAKQRFQQLGFYDLDGIFITVDGKHFPSFSYNGNILTENQSFILNHKSFTNLCKINTKFSSLINSCRYIYLGYVVCLFDSKYIIAEVSNDKVEFKLSDYAREHAEECCLIFNFKNIAITHNCYNYYGQSFLSKELEYIVEPIDSFELNFKDSGLEQEDIDEINHFYNEQVALNHRKYSSFSNTLIYHIKNKNFDNDTLAKKAKLSSRTIDNYCTDPKKGVHIDNVLALCIALQLDYEASIDLFTKAGYSLEAATPKNIVFKFLLKEVSNNSEKTNINYCNKVLRAFHQSPLPYQQGNCKKSRTKKT